MTVTERRLERSQRDGKATLRELVAAPNVDGAAAPTVRSEHAERIEAAAAEVLSANTRRAYATAWRAWSAWCAPEDVRPLPAQPVQVAAYLAERAEAGAGISALRVAVAAIAYEHASRGVPSPATHPGVRRVLHGLSRRQASQGRTPQQAAALTAEALAAIRATAHRPRTSLGGRTESAEYARRRGDTDIAIISVMRDALLRRSEAAALTWGDVECLRDGTGRLTVRRSKADQAAEGAELFIGRDATTALERIRPESPAPESLVFGGLSGRAIADRIRKAARAAGLEGDFSGHSPRIGMARDLAASGASTTALMLAGRWRSERMPALYARGELAGRGPVARYYGSS
ncbi:MAG: tyrosine-type recombinase/integrase [Chloroflexi bacterium]|nr:tyrosine-type recombinase/integrase [Chloroflexota bacterium]